MMLILRAASLQQAASVDGACGALGSFVPWRYRLNDGTLSDSLYQALEYLTWINSAVHAFPLLRGDDQNYEARNCRADEYLPGN